MQYYYVSKHTVQSVHIIIYILLSKIGSNAIFRNNIIDGMTSTTLKTNQ